MQSNNDDEKASISLKRILGICLIFLFISGMCVFAANKQVKNVNITLANGVQMDVVTSKTKVSDILSEKGIILLPEEKTVPESSAEINSDGNIKIVNKTAQEEVTEAVAETNENQNSNKTELDLNTISNAYNPITEKIIEEEQSIPFQTITKNLAEGESDTKDSVVQEGKEGKKKVTYKVKYQNDQEIERTELSSETIEEPVDKIIQVRKITNRSTATRTESKSESSSSSTDDSSAVVDTSNEGWVSFSATAYAMSGRTASGTYTTAGRTIAMPKGYAFGTKILIKTASGKILNGGKPYICEDRGGAIKGSILDIYMATEAQCIQWGRQKVYIKVVG